MFQSFRTVGLAFVLVACATGFPSQAEQQQTLPTVANFLQICRENHSACISYLWGVLDGEIVEAARAGTAYRHCTRGASYGETGDAYLSFIKAEQTNGNSAILAQTNIVTFINFMDVRYRC